MAKHIGPYIGLHLQLWFTHVGLRASFGGNVAPYTRQV